jgi:ubiquinone biosynthesis protein
MKPKLFKLLFSGYINKKVRGIWVGKPKSSQHSENGAFSPADVQNILAQAWEIYLTSAPSLPRQPRVRLWAVMNFACLTLSAYRAMLAFGIEKEYAIQLIYDLVWDVTSRSVRTANQFTTLFVQDNMRRMKILVDQVMKVLFSKPAYQTTNGKLEDGFFMDVHTCPVADYMITNQAADLCVNTWCAVDFGLVDIIGGRLERSGTRSTGEEKCDFRFYNAS